MAIPPTTELDTETKQDVMLVALAVAGPLIWLADLCGAYAISTHECGTEHAPVSWAVTIASTCVTVAAIVVGARLHGSQSSRSRAFLVEVSLMMNVLSLLLLLGFLAPLTFLRPCE